MTATNPPKRKNKEMIPALILIILFSLTIVFTVPTYLRFRSKINVAQGRLLAGSKIIQTRSGKGIRC